MFTQDDERDEDRDEDEEDADDSKNNDSDNEDDDDTDEDEDEDSDDDEDDEDSDEDDDKPVTRKELKDLLRKNGNKSNAERRVHSKDRKGGRDDKSGRRDQRHNSQKSPKTEERLSAIERFAKKAELTERKREFGYQNNLSPKQVDVVFNMTKRPTRKFLETPYVKAALDAIKSESNVRDNTPSSGGRNFKSNSGKTWEKMDDREKQDNFADRRRAILSRKKG